MALQGDGVPAEPGRFPELKGALVRKQDLDREAGAGREIVVDQDGEDGPAKARSPVRPADEEVAKGDTLTVGPVQGVGNWLAGQFEQHRRVCAAQVFLHPGRQLSQGQGIGAEFILNPLLVHPGEQRGVGQRRPPGGEVRPPVTFGRTSGGPGLVPGRHRVRP